jgi:ribosomal protein S18 acetylase RimI-like enzyme
MNICIRKARPKDCDEVIKLLKQISQLHHIGRPDIFKPGVSKYNAEDLRVKFTDPLEYIIVAADEEDHVLGYAFSYYEIKHDSRLLVDRKILYLDDLCVDDACRGKNIGSQLFDATLSHARETGCDSLELNVWDFNSPAVRFYKKHGMTVKYSRMELAVEKLTD